MADDEMRELGRKGNRMMVVRATIRDQVRAAEHRYDRLHRSRVSRERLSVYLTDPPDAICGVRVYRAIEWLYAASVWEAERMLRESGVSGLMLIGRVRPVEMRRLADGILACPVAAKDFLQCRI